MSDVFIDANVCIYLTCADATYHNHSVALFERCVSEGLRCVVSPYVINEFHFCIMKLYGKQQAKDAITSFFQLMPVSLIDPALGQKDLLEICTLCERYTIKTFDAYHAYTCKKLGIPYIATFDRDFDNIPWLKVCK